MKISDEFKVGLLATLSLAIFIFGYSFLKDKSLFKKDQSYYVIYDKIGTLGISDPIQINGFTVGKVIKQSMLTDNTGRILVTIRIKEGVYIPKNTIAKIISTDLLGEKAIELVFSKDTIQALPNDTLLADMENDFTDEISKEIAPIKQKAVELFSSIDSIITVIRIIIEEGKIEESIVNVENATSQFAKLAYDIDHIIVAESDNIKAMIANLSAITENLKNNEENINRIISNSASFTDSLAQSNIIETISSLNSTLIQLDSVLVKVNNGEGTVGKLLHDEELYNNLVAVTADADSLLADLKENPGRYVHFSLFGGGEKKEEKKKEKSKKNEGNTQESKPD